LGALVRFNELEHIAAIKALFVANPNCSELLCVDEPTDLLFFELQEGHQVGPPQQSAFLLRHFVLQDAACKKEGKQPKAQFLRFNPGQRLVEIGED
jgi:hypothetical protein